ncbi:MAG TPA: ABC transporter permease [Candidatus Aquilonibacter sp.]|nr:ABC transporter permease [Candidatus Aquilonibacter sp.]
MKVFLALTRRELASFFFSITGYVVIAAVTLLIGLSFVMLIASLGNDTFPMPVTELFFNSALFWIVLMLVTPVITMRLFALEKSTGTFETLMTTPVGDLQVVVAKFAAALVFYIIMWLPTLVCLFIVGHYTNQAGALDAGTVGGMFLGIFLAGCMFLSLGCFASAVSRSQMVAAIISLVPNVCLFILAYIAQNVTGNGSWKTQALSYFTLFQQMQDFTRGVVDTRVVVFYLSITFFFLFLTLRAVESRRWK